MSKKHCCGNCSTCSDPTSPNFVKEAKNKANANSQYGEKEPSKHTKHQ